MEWAAVVPELLVQQSAEKEHVAGVGAVAESAVEEPSKLGVDAAQVGPLAVVIV